MGGSLSTETSATGFSHLGAAEVAAELDLPPTTRDILLDRWFSGLVHSDNNPQGSKRQHRTAWPNRAGRHLPNTHEQEKRREHRGSCG